MGYMQGSLVCPLMDLGSMDAQDIDRWIIQPPRKESVGSVDVVGKTGEEVVGGRIVRSR
jgi:hypothetical protein